MSAFRETKIHGSLSYPFTIYRGVIPEVLTDFGLHWHNEMEFILVARGEIIVSIQNTEYIVREGDLAIIQPQKVHSIRQSGNMSCRYFNILFKFALLENSGKDVCAEKYFNPLYQKKLIAPEFVEKESRLGKRLRDYLYDMIDAYLLRENNELTVKSCVFGLLAGIMPYCKNADEDVLQLDNTYERLKKSLDYVQNNYSDSIRLEWAAGMSNFSPSHFSKMFRKLTGTSFTQYLKNYRLEKAAEKLNSGKESVSQVAYACGFNNISYFIRAFREKYGVTPKKYRNF